MTTYTGGLGLSMGAYQSPYGASSVTALPIKDRAATTTSRSTKKTNSVKDSYKRSSTTTKNMTDQSLAALNKRIEELAAGQDPVIAAIDQARLASIGDTSARIQAYDPNDAVARAGGRVADLERQLMEGDIANLLRDKESAGYADNALTALLGQDAAIRTSEAQARVQEDAYNQAIAGQNATTQILQSLLAGGTAADEALAAYLNIAKGAVTNTEKVDVGKDVTNTTETANTSSASYDPLAWQKYMESAGTTVADRNEKALALFQAMGGNVRALSNDFQNVYGLRQQQDAQTQLRTIQNLLR